MAEPLQPDIPKIPEPFLGEFSSPRVRSTRQPLAYWLRRIFACNPFYILSAAVLLYGLYRVSADPHFLSSETGHLVFNFSSLQCYELLLVLTAIFLARRGIGYDSMLLAALENILILVPFILVSQAALIETGIVWALSITAGILAMSRFGGL